MPHVSYSGGSATETGGRVESFLVASAIPQVNGVVVRGMIGFFDKDLLKNGVETDVTGDRDSLALELPASAD